MEDGLGELKFRPVGEIEHIVQGDEVFGHSVCLPGFQAFIDGLPDVLAARDLKRLVAAMRKARDRRRPIIWAMGAHSIKCGLTPWLLALAARGFVTSVAMNGACAIHDIELALAGETSEDVGAHLGEGCFGFADEPGRMIARAVSAVADHGRLCKGPSGSAVPAGGSVPGGGGCVRVRGLGAALCGILDGDGVPRRDLSLLAGLHRLGVTVTFHAALGTDTAHFHPALDWGLLGKALQRDFEIFVDGLRRLEGGVYLNVGSAVVLPEVFLKALSVIVNQGIDPRPFTTVNLDMIQHYRPKRNVLERPGGDAIALTGHHEIMIPLLACALLSGEGRFPGSPHPASGDGDGTDLEAGDGKG